MIQQIFQDLFGNKSICVLGFGREGKSSYKALKKYLPQNPIFIADADEKVAQRFAAEFDDSHARLFCGSAYTQALLTAEVIIKTPGIRSNILSGVAESTIISSQTDIFLRLFREQTIGVTGTKGKSTTVSLLYHILQNAGRKVVLVGNIGFPPLDLIDEIDQETLVVFEMSSHQLENIKISPAIAILLNIFQEHLDHYDSYRDYQLAKMNIGKWQHKNDYFIVNRKNTQIEHLLNEVHYPGKILGINEVKEQSIYPSQDDLIIDQDNQKYVIPGVIKDRKLQGNHNVVNISAASVAAHLRGVEVKNIASAVSSFTGLPHRIELIREWNGVRFYNDSISTIPEATIEALKTFHDVDTLLLGGFDRGIDYQVLADYLNENPVPNLIFIGAAGKRMLNDFIMKQERLQKEYICYNDFADAVNKAIELTRPGKSCLLSPAASSYDMFKNFEERGERYRQIINSL
jgi:UDP-N-acetylmuramoyl-L-alanine---L-glutamate ligase